MRILMMNCVDSAERTGGDIVQMLKTKEHLGSLGLEVDLSFELQPDLTGYDLVHLFNTFRIHETLLQARNARHHGVPYVVSPIYMNLGNYRKLGHTGLQSFLYRWLPDGTVEEIKALARSAKDNRQIKAAIALARTGYRNAQREVLSGAAMLLPNSELEMEAIRSDLQVTMPYRKVVNGIEPSYAVAEPSRELGDYVLCVGRIEPLKNQLALIEAMRGSNLKLVLVGAESTAHSGYVKEVLTELDAIGGAYLGRLPYEDVQGLYRGACVHVLPSWFETTGLVSLEALVQGCPAVSTSRGYTREYLAEFATFCEPDDPLSIRRAIDIALSAPKLADVAELVKSRYNWQIAARQTLEAYQAILQRSGKYVA